MILPLHLLHTGDEFEFGSEYVLLSKLGRHGFPIASQIIVSPPYDEVKRFLAELEVKTLADFEIRQGGLQERLHYKKPSGHTVTQEEMQYIESHWSLLVKNWLGQVHSHFIRFGEFNPKHFKLYPLPILFAVSPLASGTVVWNHLYDRPDVLMTQGELSEENFQLLQELVQKAHHKLGMHYDYHFIVDHGIKFIRLSQARHEKPRLNPVDQVKSELPKPKLKRTTKVYSTYSGNFVLDQTADGYFLKSEEFASHDEKVNVLLETMIAKSPEPILFRVSERFYKSDAAALNYCRNSKKRDNVNIVFNADISQEDLLSLKRGLAAEGINRTKKLQFLAMVSLPAAVLRLEEIIETGFDGVVFDIDGIAAALHNRDSFEVSSEYGMKALVTFLEPVIRNLQKQKQPIILSGKSVLAEIMVEQAVKWGVNSLVVDETEKTDELVAFKEHVIHFALG